MSGSPFSSSSFPVTSPMGALSNDFEAEKAAVAGSIENNKHRKKKRLKIVGSFMIAGFFM